MNFSQSWQAFVRSLRLGYEHLGKLMLANLLWFSLGFGPLIILLYLPWQAPIMLIAALLISLVMFGGAYPALHMLINHIMDRQDVSWRLFWQGFKKFAVRGTILFFIRMLGFFILGFNIWVTLNNPSTLFLILSGVWLWGIFYWYAIQQFVYPFLIRQDIGVLMTLKRAVLITLDNPLASVFVLVVSLVFGIASVFLAIPLVLFTAGFLAFLQNNFYVGIMLKYDEQEEAVVEREV
ncbi:MAG TPA: hypothetical protein GX521_08655 [Firmicutes bacterium]|nr:hypothetical protein [Bacillota bacterium]